MFYKELNSKLKFYLTSLNLIKDQRKELEEIAFGYNVSSLKENDSNNLNILKKESFPHYFILFSKSGISKASYFYKINIMDFLTQFVRLKKKHDVRINKLIKMLPEYCERGKRSAIRAQEKYY